MGFAHVVPLFCRHCPVSRSLLRGCLANLVLELFSATACCVGFDTLCLRDTKALLHHEATLFALYDFEAGRYLASYFRSWVSDL